MKAEIISSITTGDNKKFEVDEQKEIKKKRTNNQDHPLVDLDPKKICMTRTIIPNRREATKQDVLDFVKRVKGDKNKTEKAEVKKGTQKKKSTKEKLE